MHTDPQLDLRVGGFVPFTTVDFPGRLSAVIFCQGCGWRCRYCHNTHLQAFHDGSSGWQWATVKASLEERRGFLEAVVFSGGEPTAQAATQAAVGEVKAMGYLVGLHTAGMLPERLKELLPLLDWVGLDIKAPLDERYEATTRQAGGHRVVSRSLDLLLESGVGYELRTTVHPALLGEREKEDIVAELARRGAHPPKFQVFRSEGCRDDGLLAA
jgi:pyruvate formate lyase activating enzyme